MNPCLVVADIETSALEEKHKREHYTQLVGACLVRLLSVPGCYHELHSHNYSSQLHAIVFGKLIASTVCSAFIQSALHCLTFTHSYNGGGVLTMQGNSQLVGTLG